MLKLSNNMVNALWQVVVPLKEFIDSTVYGSFK